jgi:8-oxo-dGTP diphosphatase
MLTPPNLLLVVGAALIGPDARILVQQRPPRSQMAGYWEFPGGKIEAGETPQMALVRELHEELGIIVEPENLVPVSFASEALGARHLLLLLFACRCWQGDPKPIYADALQWADIAALRSLLMPPADIPLIEDLQRYLEG